MGLSVELLESAERDVDRHMFAPLMTTDKRLAFNEALERTRDWISNQPTAGTPIVRVVNSDLMKLVPTLKTAYYKGLIDYPHKPNYKIIYLLLTNAVHAMRVASDNDDVSALLFAKFVGTTVL